MNGALAVRTLHVLAVVIWMGGMLFIALVLVPVVRRLGDPVLRARLVTEMRTRFRTVAWIALAVLLATGLLNLWHRPYLLKVPRFQIKLALVVVALVGSVAHDFVLGPRAGNDPVRRRRATWMARLNVLVVLAIVALGIALRG